MSRPPSWETSCQLATYVFGLNFFLCPLLIYLVIDCLYCNVALIRRTAVTPTPYFRLGEAQEQVVAGRQTPRNINELGADFMYSTK